MNRVSLLALLLAALLSACGTLAPEPDAVPDPAQAPILAPTVAGTEVYLYTQVSAGDDHTCGLNENGSVACWGDNEFGQASPPSGTFTQVSAGGFHTCGLKEDGTVACWGNNSYGQASPPSGAFTQVSAGKVHTCGLKEDGSVACWGSNGLGQASPPSGTFIQVSGGFNHTCGLEEDGSVTCWGESFFGQASPPSGTFTQVSAGDYHTCSLEEDGSVACWGFNGSGQASPPSGTFMQVSAGSPYTCGLKEDGAVACWGNNSFGQSSPPSGTFTQVSAGEYHTCGLKGDKLVACWGWNNRGQATPPTPPVLTSQPQAQRLDAGEAFSLSVTATGAGLSYRWRKDGIPIDGATESLYSVPSATASDAGLYDVVVTNVAGRTTSESVRVRVDRLEQTVSFTSAPPTDATVGGTYTPTATASSGLNVVFTTAGSCTVSGGAVRFVGAGLCTVRASQGGNGMFIPAYATQDVTVSASPPVPREPASYAVTLSGLPLGRIIWDVSLGRGVESESGTLTDRVRVYARRKQGGGNMAMVVGNASVRELVIAMSKRSRQSNPRGGRMDFKFDVFGASGRVNIESLKLSGVSTAGGSVEVYRDRRRVKRVAIPRSGNVVLGINTENVGLLRVNLTGPGRVDDLVFEVPNP